MMKPSSRSRSSLTLLAGAVGVLILTAACGSSSGGSASTTGASAGASQAASATGGVSTADTAAGTILVAPDGQTMYSFAADKKGTSNCNGSCAVYWPPVKAGAKAGSGVTATLGKVTRADGTSQLTVDGWPMYTYIGDKKPGAISGQALNLDGGLWWVVDPSGKWITKAVGSNAPVAPGY